MASLIPGYEYDIFISYRQKDNKGDRWVSEFVEALKTELESTFKEDVSVYFDINPHDGLLETHDVDASLKDKLKCLVFIPIISRTYCDPKSFAWEHEFKAFVEQASQDQFGLKVKLPNGNVASRVLPVRIYDLNANDIKLCESILGGVLRSVDFIYKSAGVNRPLRANEDHPQDNSNKTYYRDQINKVANSIEEIITSIGSHIPQKEVSKEVFKTVSAPRKSNKVKIIIGSVILLALIVLGYFLIPKHTKPKEQVEKSIAVLPFKLLSNEPDKQYLADGMMDEITLHLSKIKELRVLGRTSTEQYRKTDKTLNAIGKELDVAYLLEGSFQKFGDNARLIVQLIKTGKEGHVWANDYDRNWSDIFKVQSEVAQKIADELNAAITPEEKQLIEKVPTSDLTAYDFYQRGREEHTKYWIDNSNKASLQKAEDLYHKSLKYDSTFAQAYSGLAEVYWDKHYQKEYFSEYFMDSVLFFTKVALSYNDQLDEAYAIRGNYYYEKGLPEQAIKEFDKALKLNPNYWVAYLAKAGVYYSTDLVNYINYLQKAASLNHGSGLPDILRAIAYGYQDAGFTEKANYYALEAFKLDGDSVKYFNQLGYLEQKLANYEKSVEFLERSYDLDTTNIFTLGQLGTNCGFAGQMEKSLKYCKEFVTRIKNLGAEHPFNGAINHRIGYAYWKNGYREESEYYFNKQLEECNNLFKSSRPWSQMYYTYYDIAGVYAFRGDKDKAYKNLRIFNQRKLQPLWMLSTIKNDPLFNSMRNEPEFQQIVRDVEAKYQAEHERVRKWLEENNML